MVIVFVDFRTFALNFDYDFFRNDFFRNSALYGISVLLRMVAQDVVLFKKMVKTGPKSDPNGTVTSVMVTRW